MPLILLVLAGSLMAADDYEAYLLERGEWVFERRCMVCHGNEGRGLVGPNLTDNYWLYGPDKDTLIDIISKGREDKGMPAWDKELSRGELGAVLRYVMSLRGRDLPGKEPQGELVGE
ncbi:MAG: c-type cytochrome [Planctomycetota bacterium]